MIEVSELDPKGWTFAEADEAGKVQVCLEDKDGVILGLALVDAEEGRAPSLIGYCGNVYEFIFGACGTYLYQESETARKETEMGPDSRKDESKRSEPGEDIAAGLHAVARALDGVAAATIRAAEEQSSRTERWRIKVDESAPEKGARR